MVDLDAICAEILALPADQRAQAMSARAGGDPALIQVIRARVKRAEAPPSRAREKLQSLLGRQLGPYHVEARLGQGATATVWRVRHVQQDLKYALKLLHHPGQMLRRRLQEEGRIQSQLRHPNIVRVVDVIDTSSGLGLVMELVEGPSLEALLRTRQPLSSAIDLGAEIIEGVAYAHRMGLIHRDLKPANILLQPSGHRLIPRVVDFGIAKALDTDQRQTRTGTALGTPGYMAPEQFRDASRVDARADVFALGAILYELVTGTRTFSGGDFIALFERAAQMAYTPPDELEPSLPPALAAAICTALRAEPDQRFPNAGALAAAWLKTGDASRPTFHAASPLAWDQDEPPASSGPPSADTFVDDTPFPAPAALPPLKPPPAKRPAPAPAPVPLPSTAPRAFFQPWVGIVGLVAVLAGLGAAYQGTRHTPQPTAAPAADPDLLEALRASVPTGLELTIEATPEDTQVTVDGNALGAAPAQAADLEAGVHHIRLSAGDQVFEQTVMIDQDARCSWTPEADEAWSCARP